MPHWADAALLSECQSSYSDPCAPYAGIWVWKVEGTRKEKGMDEWGEA